MTCVQPADRATRVTDLPLCHLQLARGAETPPPPHTAHGKTRGPLALLTQGIPSRGGEARCRQAAVLQDGGPAGQGPPVIPADPRHHLLGEMNTFKLPEAPTPAAATKPPAPLPARNWALSV